MRLSFKLIKNYNIFIEAIMKKDIKNNANEIKETVHYKTKQRDLIIEYFKKSKKKHITADDIIKHFKDKNISCSKATIYRTLDMLLKEELITKYMIDEKTSSCYALIDHDCDGLNHYHLRCSSCDKVFHIDGEEFNKMKSKIKQEFDFDVDISKTVLYGKCKDCKKKDNKKKEKECEELKEDVKHKELEIQDWIKQYKLAHLKCHYLEPSIKQYINDICERYDICEKTYHEKIAIILRDSVAPEVNTISFSSLA